MTIRSKDSSLKNGLNFLLNFISYVITETQNSESQNSDKNVGVEPNLFQVTINNKMNQHTEFLENRTEGNV